jgi:hypothetical protein
MNWKTVIKFCSALAKSCHVLPVYILYTASMRSHDTYHARLRQLQWNFPKRSSTGTKKIGRFRGVASLERLLLQRIVKQWLKKMGHIQGGTVCFLRVRCKEISLYIQCEVFWHDPIFFIFFFFYNCISRWLSFRANCLMVKHPQGWDAAFILELPFVYFLKLANCA